MPFASRCWQAERMPTLDLASVYGVPECTLADEVLASLPHSAPAAPWEDCRFTSIMWFARGGRAAAAAAGVVGEGARALAVIGGMVSYEKTPVGAYHEVFGVVGLQQGRGAVGTVPFMAVDSRDSLVGGRSNWSLPKCLASFSGEPASGAMVADGDGWQVRVTARPFGPAYPLPMEGRVAQLWPDGVVRSSLLDGRARARTALVTVEVASDGSLPRWLRPGRHLGSVTLDASFSLCEAS